MRSLSRTWLDSHNGEEFTPDEIDIFTQEDEDPDGQEFTEALMFNGFNR